MKTPLAALLLSLTLLTASCGHPGDPDPAATTPGGTASTGIKGLTIVDGGCPMIKTSSPCPDKPLAAHLTVTKVGSDQPVANVDSDHNGGFQIPLPPGDYTLHPANLTGALHPAASPITVHVQDSRYTIVTVPFDSGIR